MKNKKLSIGILVAGLAVLIAGVTALIIKNNEADRAADGEFLVSAGEWTLSNEDGVIWDFTEVGKGTLTTNNHTNDYDFIWALDGKKLKIETDWLYDLENEYDYELDQAAKILTLKNGDDEFKFVAK